MTISRWAQVVGAMIFAAYAVFATGCGSTSMRGDIPQPEIRPVEVQGG
ncbi:hypothetical protein [Mycobacterium asiaticum]|nr:hypothetical protein [Mycobacterium asiaticum]